MKLKLNLAAHASGDFKMPHKQLPQHILDMIEKSGPPISFEDILSGKANPNHGRRFSELEMYLEGDKVSRQWIKSMLERRSHEQPHVLYRLCIVSGDAKEGKVINVKKGLISAADRINSAIYAGCSYHKDVETDITDKQLAVIEIHNPHVCMSFNEIVKAVSEKNEMAHSRLKNEREYLIKGPVSGKIIRIVPHSFLTLRNYKVLEI